MDLVIRHDFTNEDMSRKKVVVHCFLNDLSDRSIGEFDKGVVLGSSGLGDTKRRGGQN